jgi:multidrug efflux pump
MFEAESASLEKTAQIHDQIYELVKEFSEVKSVTSSVGTGLPKFFITVVNSSPALDVAQLLLTIDLTDSLYKSNEEFGFAIQQKINETVIGAKVEVRYLEYAMPVEAKLVFALNGEDLDDLLATSANIRELLSAIPGTTSIRDSFVSKEYEYVVRIDEDYLATSGILKYDIVKQINTALMGATPSGFKSGGTEMEILVKADINSLEQLYRLPIKSSATDAYMQLSQLVRVDIQATLPSIYRQNRKRTVTVLADVLPGYSAASVELAFKELINEDLLAGRLKN